MRMLAAPSQGRTASQPSHFDGCPAFAEATAGRQVVVPCFQTNERFDNDGATPAFIRRDDARGRLVDPAVAGFYRIVDFPRLFHVGGVSGKQLFRWQLPLAILFAGTFWRFAAQLVWTEAVVVARLAYLFSGAFNSLGSGRIPAHLLLLSRRLLQGVLGRSSGVHRGRATENLLGRAVVSADHAKCASLFPLSGARDHFDPCLRCLESAVVCRSNDRQKLIWNRRRHDRARDQCISIGRLYVRVSFITTFNRRISRSTCKVANLLSRLRLRELLESASHALGMDESLLGRL